MNLINSDCLEALKLMPDNCIDAIVTDPPYGLAFMGKKWDYDVPSVELWAECLRVLKPGGHLLAFAGTRTQHRMAVRIEDAGFEIRDMIAWVYGSGFPKSLAVDKALDGVLGKQGKGFKAAGDDGREAEFKQDLSKRSDYGYKYEPATDAAKQWEGWGTALKPALEPITVARKPLIGTVADNVLAHGTGGINVDGCRVGDEVRTNAGMSSLGVMHDDNWQPKDVSTTVQGRWPANLIHDGSDEVVAMFPNTAPSKASAGGGSNPNPMDWGNSRSDGDEVKGHTDNGGSASRFFYCAKASKKDRDEGLDGFEKRENANWPQSMDGDDKRGAAPRANIHPTVKPTDLMRYLCRLVTPSNGVVLDPFMGSGSTGKAAVLEGFRFIGIEREAAYFEIASARVLAATDSIFNDLWM
jgi:site-specific DNA-methyltransferase (adenine-specific)